MTRNDLRMRTPAPPQGGAVPPPRARRRVGPEGREPQPGFIPLKPNASRSSHSTRQTSAGLQPPIDIFDSRENSRTLQSPTNRNRRTNDPVSHKEPRRWPRGQLAITGHEGNRGPGRWRRLTIRPSVPHLGVGYLFVQKYWATKSRRGAAG